MDFFNFLGQLQPQLAELAAQASGSSKLMVASLSCAQLSPSLFYIYCQNPTLTQLNSTQLKATIRGAIKKKVTNCGKLNNFLDPPG